MKRIFRNLVWAMLPLLFMLLPLLTGWITSAFSATGCNYPATLDSWADKATGDFLTIADVNQRSCAIEKLESGPLRPNDGTAAAPAYAFRTSATAGMYLSAADELSWSTSSTQFLKLTSAGSLESVSTGAIKADAYAAGTVNTTALKTATGSATGGDCASYNVTMNDYSFFPSITSNQNRTDDTYTVENFESLAPSDTIGRLHIQCTTATGTASATRVAWRYVTASRPAELVIARNIISGVVVAVWKSQIDDSSRAPITVDAPNVEIVEITDFPDRLLNENVMAWDILSEIKASTLNLGTVARPLPAEANVRDDHPLMQEAARRGRVVFIGAKVGKLTE